MERVSNTDRAIIRLERTTFQIQTVQKHVWDAFQTRQFNYDAKDWETCQYQREPRGSWPCDICGLCWRLGENGDYDRLTVDNINYS